MATEKDTLMSDPVLYVNCPKCDRKHEDHDGIGVLFCEHCGYCTHASVTGDTCDFCGAVDDPYEAIGESRMGLPGGGSL